MKCDKCNKDTETHKFYYGFFSVEYDESKWCYLCDECILEFLKASNVYSFKRDYLIEFYNDLVKKLENKKERHFERCMK